MNNYRIEIIVDVCGTDDETLQYLQNLDFTFIEINGKKLAGASLTQLEFRRLLKKINNAKIYINDDDE